MVMKSISFMHGKNKKNFKNMVVHNGVLKLGHTINHDKLYVIDEI